MTHLSKKLLRLKLKKTNFWRVSILRRCVGSLRDQVLACWIHKPIRYRQIVESGPTASICHRFPSGEMTPGSDICDHDHDASDLVALKISLFPDNQIGKTSFVAKYVVKEKKQEDFPPAEVRKMDKILSVTGARISYSIWEVGGDAFSADNGGSTAANGAPVKTL